MKFRTICQLIIKYQKTPLPGNYNSNNIQSPRRVNTAMLANTGMQRMNTVMPVNAAMPANTAMPMFQTSCETEMHMKIWLIVNCFV